MHPLAEFLLDYCATNWSTSAMSHADSPAQPHFTQRFQLYNTVHQINNPHAASMIDLARFDCTMFLIFRSSKAIRS